MKAIKIIIDGSGFLLPDSHHSYEFPTYILEYIAILKKYIKAGKKLTKNPLINHFDGLEDLTEFKEITGIIGFPFNTHDADLFAIDRNIEIAIEVKF